MPNFLEDIFVRLQSSPNRLVLREVHGDQFVSVTCGELLVMVEHARQWLRSQQIPPGERCGLIAGNSIRWIAADLALMAEGIVVVPLYHRQTALELAGMLKDCQPRLVLTGDDETYAGLTAAWPEIPQPIAITKLFDSIAQPRPTSPVRARTDADLLTIIYTSGTSGEAKGVCLTVGNLDHMTGSTTERLDQLMSPGRKKVGEPDQ